MGRPLPCIDDAVRTFIEAQPVFFVATAPLSADGHVNVSPKGLASLRVLAPDRVAYVDYVGSGAETIAHLRENGRIVLMFCAFDGPPQIVRLHGRGRVVRPDDDEFGPIAALWPEGPSPRAAIVVDVTRVSRSCGFGVPLADFRGPRTQLVDWADRKGPDGLREYQRARNARSLDGLPAIDWIEPPD